MSAKHTCQSCGGRFPIGHVRPGGVWECPACEAVVTLVPKSSSAIPRRANAAVHSTERTQPINSWRKRKFFLIYCLATSLLTGWVIHLLIQSKQKNRETEIMARADFPIRDASIQNVLAPVGEAWSIGQNSTLSEQKLGRADLEIEKREVLIPVNTTVENPEHRFVSVVTKTELVPEKSEKIIVTQRPSDSAQDVSRVERKTEKIISDPNGTQVVTPTRIVVPTGTRSSASSRTTTITRPTTRYVTRPSTTTSPGSYRSTPSTTRRTTTTRVIRTRIVRIR